MRRVSALILWDSEFFFCIKADNILVYLLLETSKDLTMSDLVDVEIITQQAMIQVDGAFILTNI